jgi:hypothetical protein
MVRCARQNEGSVLTAPHGRSECCGPPETRKRGPGPGPVSVPRFGNVRNRDMLAPFSGFRFIELFSQPNRKPHLIMPPIPDCRSQIAAMPAGHTAQASVLVSVLASRKTKMWRSALLPCMHAVETRNSGIESSSAGSWANRPHPRIRSIVLLGRGLTVTKSLYLPHMAVMEPDIVATLPPFILFPPPHSCAPTCRH